MKNWAIQTSYDLVMFFGAAVFFGVENWWYRPIGVLVAVGGGYMSFKWFHQIKRRRV